MFARITGPMVTWASPGSDAASTGNKVNCSRSASRRRAMETEDRMVKRPSSGCPSFAATYTPLDSRVVLSSRVRADRSCSYVLPSTRRPMEETIRSITRLVIAMQELDVNVLIEGSGQAVARAGEHTPPATALRGEGNCRVLGGVAQSEDWERFKGAVENDSTRRDSPTGHEGHAERI